jgi:hypothetical protein
MLGHSRHSSADGQCFTTTSFDKREDVNRLRREECASDPCIKGRSDDDVVAGPALWQVVAWMVAVSKLKHVIVTRPSFDSTPLAFS